jgi:2-iminobutanoate/2-iminopropanoate deaminase
VPNQVVSTPDAPESRDYSQAVRAGNTIYVAGTTGVDPATGQFAGSTVEAQTRQALRNAQAILAAAGAELHDAVMVHTLLAHSADAAAVGGVFEEFWPDVRPPRCVSKIGVERPNLLVSIALIAVVD